MRVNWSFVTVLVGVPAIGVALWILFVSGAMYLIASPSLYDVVTTVILHR